MTKKAIKEAERRKRLRGKALLYLKHAPIHEVEEAPLQVIQQLISEGLAMVGRKYVANGWRCREIVLTDAGRAAVRDMQP